MSNLDNIIKKIENDGKTKADSIIKEAEKKAQETILKYESDAKVEAENIVKRANRDAKSIVEKAISSAELKARDMKLMSKQIVVEKTLENVKNRLKNLDDKSYISYLKKALEKFGESDKYELLVQKDKLEAVKEAKLPWKLSEETVASGFSIRDNNVIYNNDFSSLVDSLKDQLEVEIVNKLFGR